jgi:hypothetical protein
VRWRTFFFWFSLLTNLILWSVAFRWLALGAFFTGISLIYSIYLDLIILYIVLFVTSICFQKFRRATIAFYVGAFLGALIGFLALGIPVLWTYQYSYFFKFSQAEEFLILSVGGAAIGCVSGGILAISAYLKYGQNEL